MALFGKNLGRPESSNTAVKLERSGMLRYGNFICNLVAARHGRRLIARTGIGDAGHGLKLGAGVGLGFSERP